MFSLRSHSITAVEFVNLSYSGISQFVFADYESF